MLSRPAAALLAALPLAWISGANAESPDCAAIAAATVAELRAGAVAWGEAEQSLARRAAGAACVKARGVSAPAAGAETAVPAGSRAEDAEADAAASTGFRRNEISGLPGKKPYRRKRE